MYKKIKNIAFPFLFVVFIFLIISYYLSDKNIIYINKSRSSYSLGVNQKLPILKNDTSNIITYKNGLDEFKKKRKKRFWEKLISNKNE